MQLQSSRREFIIRGSQFCALCGCVGLAGKVRGEEAKPDAPAKALPPLSARGYCGAMCDMSCQLFKATAQNNIAKKREVFERRKWKEKFGIEFDEAQVFCYGCKPGTKPLSMFKAPCLIRKCTIERGLESCLQCKRLADCEQAFWQEFPKFKKQVDDWQAEYLAAGLVKLS